MNIIENHVPVLNEKICPSFVTLFCLSVEIFAQKLIDHTLPCPDTRILRALLTSLPYYLFNNLYLLVSREFLKDNLQWPGPVNKI
jgi:hypothetical protein